MRWLAFILTLSVLCCGCAELSAPPTETVQEPTPATCPELIAKATEFRDKAESTHDVYQESKESFRKRILQKQIREGLEIVDQVTSHPAATAVELDEVRSIKADLLYFGASNFKSPYVEELQDFAKTMVEEAKGATSTGKAVSRWLWIKLANPKTKGFGAAEKTILNFVRTWPDAEEAPALLARLAMQMVGDGKLAESRMLLARAEKLVKDPSILDDARSVVAAQQQRYKTKQVAIAASNRYRSMVRSRLGGRESGCFVVFSKAKKKSWCDYSVCKGIDEVVKYAKEAEYKDWNWKLIETFPETKDGYRRADERTRELLRKNTLRLPYVEN